MSSLYANWWQNRREQIWQDYKDVLWARLTLVAIVQVGDQRFEKEFDWSEHAHTSLFSGFFPRIYRDGVRVTEGVPLEMYADWVTDRMPPL